ncbi:hypothetical protein Tco_0839900 [Tanacetum coccineum]|uniref:Synaptobrevin, longin-like domain protein n=1 Tax=Tanacetum coccineum TaxID=301880 RepID=A0ABQ5ASW5_9ASTR
MVALTFASSHNIVAFLDTPTESDGFEQIVDFLNARPIKYALTVNLTIYTTCIEQFWATTKVKTVNGEVQIQALVDKKKVIITETSVRSDLQLEHAEGTEFLPNAIIFEQLTLMGYKNLTQKLTFYKAFFSPQWKFLIHTILQCLSAKTTAWNEFSSTMAYAIICLATNQKFSFSKYIFDNMVKNLEGGVKFLVYLRFVQVFLDKKVEGMSKHKEIYVTPSHTKKVFANMKRQGKDFSDETENVASVPIHSNDLLLSGEDRLQLNELMDLCTNLQKKVLDLEKAKTAQDSEIASLKKRVKKLERMNKSRTPGLKRLRKIGRTARIESSKDEASLGDQEDASKQGRKIADIDADAETQGRNDDNLMFDTGVLDEQEVKVEKVVSTAEVTTNSATTTTVDELTLAQTLIEIKAAKPKVRGVMIQDPSKAKMIEPEKPLKKKDHIMFDKEVAQKLQAQLEVELEEEEKLTRQREEEANIALIESWDNIQAKINVDYQIAQQLQAEEQEQLSIEEKSKLFVQLLEARKKHFAEMRAREKRNKPPT